MRRISTAKRASSRQNEMKVLPLTNLISTLLTTTSSDFNMIESFNSSKINPNKFQSPRGRQQNYASRPQTSNYKNEQLNQKRPKNDFMSCIIDSPERKSFRPKSSINNAGHFKSSSLSHSNNGNDLNPKQQNNFTIKQVQNHETRRFSSTSTQKHSEYKIEYRLIQADNPFERLPNKPPKSIQSTKSIGLARAYGVNSHKFHNSSEVCEGRILIIANLTKTTKIQAITSLYALFQSNKSILYIDFVREHFQIQICKKLDHFPPPQITKQLIQGCLHRVQNKFCEMYNVPIKKNASVTMSITNNFGLSYSMVFIRNDQIIVCTKGVTHAKSSVNYGSKLQGQHSNSLNIRKISKQEIDSLDYIALISEAKEWLIIKNREWKPIQWTGRRMEMMRRVGKINNLPGFKDKYGRFYQQIF